MHKRKLCNSKSIKKSFPKSNRATSSENDASTLLSSLEGSCKRRDKTTGSARTDLAKTALASAFNPSVKVPSSTDDSLEKSIQALAMLKNASAIAEECSKMATVENEDPDLEKYKSLSKEELIEIINELRKKEEERNIAVKAYKTLVEIAARNVERDIGKKARKKRLQSD